MTEKFRHKYRISSTRLPFWDYAWPAAYFVTICIRNREYHFGRIVDDTMQLSPIGKLADECWQDIPKHTRNVELDAFVVMPNHIHGIIILHDNSKVETLHATSLPKNPQMSSISPKSGSLSTIIRSYKSAVTKHVHRQGYNFSWQPRFYDHVIRNQKSLLQKENYILNNPANWHRDPLFPKDNPHNRHLHSNTP